MINVYSIYNDNNGHPYLHVDKEIDYPFQNLEYIDDVVRILNEYLDVDKLSIERAYVVAYNNDCDVLGIMMVSSGNSTTCYFYPKLIAQFLLLVGADQFCIFHNHPGRSLKPSEPDIKTTLNLPMQMSLIDVKMMGSYIISSDGWKEVKYKEKKIKKMPELIPE